MKALLAAPDRREAHGFRDYALLLFLYNTGARASEAIRLIVGDLDLVRPAVTLHGKGRKIRRCPLWKVTAAVLRELVTGRAAADAIFVSQRGGPIDPLWDTYSGGAVGPACRSHHPDPAN